MAIFLPCFQAKKPLSFEHGICVWRLRQSSQVRQNLRWWHICRSGFGSLTRKSWSQRGEAGAGLIYPTEVKHLINGTTKNKPQSCCIQKLQDLGFSQVSTATGKFMEPVARIEIIIIIIIIIIINIINIYHWGILAPTSVLPRYRSRSKVLRNMEFSGFFEQKKSLWMHLSSKKLQEMSIRTKSSWLWVWKWWVALPSGYRKSCSLLALPL